MAHDLAAPPAVLAMIDRPCRSSAADATSAEAPPAFRLVPARSPQLRVTDLAVTRGDGIFESATVRDGVIHSEERHLHRFARSAAMLDLPEPDLDVYRAATRAAVAALGELDLPPGAEAYVKYCLSRGDEELTDVGPIGWAYATLSGDFTAARTEGIAVVLLDRGYARTVPATSPWLLAGAKTLAYAVNRAAVREAVRRGAQDVVFTTPDGYLLEGPTSTLVLRIGDTLVTPPPEVGVLPGTTQEDLFASLDDLGLRGEERDVRVPELAAADAAWLMSSVRLAAPVNAVDGVAVPVDHELTARINELLQTRTG